MKRHNLTSSPHKNALPHVPLRSTSSCPFHSSYKEITLPQASFLYFPTKEWNLQPFYIGPRVDGDYIPDEPATLLQKDDYNHVPTIMGINRDEMAMETVGKVVHLASFIGSFIHLFSHSLTIIHLINICFNFWLSHLFSHSFSHLFI